MSMPRLNRELELTRRINDQDAVTIEAILADLPDVDQSIALLAEDIGNGNWNSASIKNKMMPYIALLGYQNGAINKDDFVTLMLYWVARKQYGDQLMILTPTHPDYTRSLSANLTVHPTALAMKKFQMLFENKKNFRMKNAYYFSAADLESFLQVVSMLPRSQQVMFSALENIATMQLPDKNLKIIDVLSGDNVNFFALTRNIITSSIFSYFLPETVDAIRLIPSLGLMQAYLNTKFGENAVVINPVMGVSSVKQIRVNGLEKSRDMAFVFPGVNLPAYADHYLAQGDDFRVHDFYHAFAASAVPHEHRVLMVGLADVIKAYLPKQQALMRRILRSLPFAEDAAIMNLIFRHLYGEDKRTLHYVADTLIDMEHPHYRVPYCTLVSDKREFSLEKAYVESLLDVLAKPALANIDLLTRQHGFHLPYTLPPLVVRIGLFNAIVQYIFSAAPEIRNYLEKSHLLETKLKQYQEELLLQQPGGKKFAEYNDLKNDVTNELAIAVKHVTRNPAIFFKPSTSQGGQLPAVNVNHPEVGYAP
jgi:hypothetical protein